MFEYSSVEEALEDLKKGKIIIVADDEDRENEGDLICAGEFATVENVNFMASYAKGLICMPMSKEMTKKLELNQMVANNTDNHSTAFTVSIDHIDTTTGISAAERSFTALKCAEDDAKPEDFRRPGHMFPLEARQAGLMERRGHTEATVDLMRLAGLKEFGLCCEIMRSDGTMMRSEELKEFSLKHNLKFITVDNIIKYIKKTEKNMQKAAEAKLPTKYGEFKIIGFENKKTSEHHIALIKGCVDDGNPVLTRVHCECLTGDVFGSNRCDCGDQFEAAMEEIARQGRGVIIYLRQEGRGIGLINKIRAYALQDNGMDTVEANIALGFDADMRNYSAAADMLKAIGVNKIDLITNNPDKIKGLEANGIEVCKRIEIKTKHKKECEFYMKTKKDKMGHILKDY